MKEELQNYQNNDRLIRSYGRIKSRRLSDHKSSLLENISASYEISAGCFAEKNITNNIDALENQASTTEDSINSAQKNSFSKVSFEIGFGFGDFIFAKAQANPNQMFLGCEPHINGVVNVLAKLEENPLSNIKISRDDARELLAKFPDNFFDEVYILFPDPWPKIKHFKRRLINVDLLDNLLARKLKLGGKLIIATDHDSYKTWILAEILKSQKFNWQAASKQDWQVFPSDWIETKYQKKAQREGRVSVIFNLERI